MTERVDHVDRKAGIRKDGQAELEGKRKTTMEESSEKQLKMKKMQEKQKKGMKRDWMMLGITIISTGLILSFFPDKRDPVTTTSWGLLVEMMMIFPAVIIMMGLFSVWVQKEMIVKHLGKASGIKGIFLSLFLGAVPTGPLYIAFPIAAGLMKKGARISNIIVFLSAWACIKIPQEIVELQFLGLEFMLLRLSLTVIMVIIMGVLIEKIIEWAERKNDGIERTDKANKRPGSTEAIQHGS